MKKDQKWINERIELLKESSLEMERFCHEKLGMPILTEEEKKIQRKRIYEEIIKECENKPRMTDKELFNEVMDIIKLLEEDCKL